MRNSNYYNRIKQFAKFGMVGVANTVISYLVYLLAISLGLSYIIGNTLGFFIGNLNSFFWNNRYVFKSNENHQNLLVTYIKQLLSCAFTGVLLNNALLYLLIQYMHIDKVFAPLIILLFTVPLNFIICKFWAYKK